MLGSGLSEAAGLSRGSPLGGGSSLIGFLLTELMRFTAEDWEREDDIILA